MTRRSPPRWYRNSAWRIILTLLFAVSVLFVGIWIIAGGTFTIGTPSERSPSPTALSSPAPSPDQLLLTPNEAPPTPLRIEESGERVERSLISPDMKRILERGYLIVALLERDNPPFFVTDEPQGLYGLDIKIARAIAAYLGVEVQFDRSAQTFDDTIDAIYHLRADIAISKLSQTLNRARRVRFSRPYVTMRQGLLINRLHLAEQTKNRAQPLTSNSNIYQLKGKIGVIQGSSYVGFVQNNFPNATMVEYPGWMELVQAVIQGDVVAACRDELEIKKVILTQPEAVLQMQTLALSNTKDTIAIALPWDSQHLLAFVNQYLETANLDYTADSLLNEYAETLQTIEQIHLHFNG